MRPSTEGVLQIVSHSCRICQVTFAAVPAFQVRRGSPARGPAGERCQCRYVQVRALTPIVYPFEDCWNRARIPASEARTGDFEETQVDTQRRLGPVGIEQLEYVVEGPLELDRKGENSRARRDVENAAGRWAAGRSPRLRLEVAVAR